MVFVGKRLAESDVVLLDFIVALRVFFMTVNLNLSLLWHLEEMDHKGAIQTFSFSVKLLRLYCVYSVNSNQKKSGL